jgi:hypothetical protein
MTLEYSFCLRTAAKYVGDKELAEMAMKRVPNDFEKTINQLSRLAYRFTRAIDSRKRVTAHHATNK